MENEKSTCGENCCLKHKCKRHGVLGGSSYGLGFIGSLIYFLQNADTFWIGALGVIKAIFWPAVLVYKLLAFLN